MEKNIITKHIELPISLVKKIEKKIQNYPTLNLNTVIIEALELWLQGTDQVKLEKDRELFINDNSTGFGPRAKD